MNWYGESNETWLDSICIEGETLLLPICIHGISIRKHINIRGGAACSCRGRATPTEFAKINGKLLFSIVHSCSRPQRLMHLTPAAFSSGFAPDKYVWQKNYIIILNQYFFSDRLFWCRISPNTAKNAGHVIRTIVLKF